MAGEVGTSKLEHSFDLPDDVSQWDEALLAVPAKWCVYLLASEHDEPVQLLCARNARASIRNRLTTSSDEPTRRADLSEVVRRVYWTRVDSVFEQDLVYLEAGRHFFPETYAGNLGFRPATLVHVNPQTTYPRFTKSQSVDKQTGRWLGPMPESSSASKFVHGIEDAFDLCRDWEKFTAEGSTPCQWREMGKCVGPCEGPPAGVSLDAYRALVDHAATVAGNLDDAIEFQTLRMKAAAAAMNFEVAGDIKEFVAKLESLRGGNFRHVGPLDNSAYLGVLPGENAKQAKLYLATATSVRRLATTMNPPDGKGIDALLRSALEAAEAGRGLPETTEQHERLSLVTHHLYPSRKVPGEWLAMKSISEKQLKAALKTIAKLKETPESDDVGEAKGLQT